MLHPSLRGTTTYALMHVTDWLPTLVGLTGEPAVAKPGFELDGSDQSPHLLEAAPSARTETLINIERTDGTTAPGSTPGKCDSHVLQAAVVVGAHKIIVGGGGTPNTWYHDDLPYPNGTSAPVPQGGCIKACQAPSPSGCPATPMVQVFNVLEDESERNDLAKENPAL
eukprot:UC1_evm1s1295